VIALEGDGSDSDGARLPRHDRDGQEPRNLTIVIMDNGIYQITGRQKAATCDQRRYRRHRARRRNCNSHWVRDEKPFRATVCRGASTMAGRCCWRAKIDDKPGTAQTVRDPPLIRKSLHAGLGTGRASALDA